MKNRDDRRQVFVAIAAGVGGGIALLGLILLVEVVWAPPWSVAARALGWAVPLASAVIIGVVSWALLLQGGTARRDDDSLYITCHSCGRPVFREWRLCPYCGVRLQPVPSGQPLHQD
jgi:hypothetical protein